ncbi:HGGxSTG domain-containing protein [Limimaricola cinnabarinus]|uniref:HGGxSTG domain-containing protein n=1 Tax=Limimaricola cinnabarinus TaxID=1125964 RepID=UPI00272EC4CA|nr:HGGxSTG domain-containing protein [Limimaricola cinnabarinus]
MKQRTARRARSVTKKPNTQCSARLQLPCGAIAPKGCPCRMRPEPGRNQCKFHGGRNTGPRTPAGRARIAEAQRHH